MIKCTYIIVSQKCNDYWQKCHTIYSIQLGQKLLLVMNFIYCLNEHCIFDVCREVLRFIFSWYVTYCRINSIHVKCRICSNVKMNKFRAKYNWVGSVNELEKEIFCFE